MRLLAQVLLTVNDTAAACGAGINQCSYQATAAATPNITAVNVTAAQVGSRQLIMEGSGFSAEPGATTISAAEQVGMCSKVHELKLAATLRFQGC